MPRKIIATCSTCGEDFIVHLGENGRIPDDVYYGGKMRFGVGDWCSSRAKLNPDGSLFKGEDGLIVWERIYPWYIELGFKAKDIVKTLLHMYKEFDYFECPKCYAEVKARHPEE